MKFLRRSFILALAVGALVACSLIKEDRTPCPCWLQVVVDREKGPVARISAWKDLENVLMDEGRIDVRDYPDYYEGRVRKGFLDVSCLVGLSDGILQGKYVLIAQGMQSDTLWAHCSKSVNCNYEFAYDTVRLHKQFARVKLRIQLTRRDMEMGYSLYPIIRSNIRGMDLTDLKTPLTGEFAPADPTQPDGPYNSVFAHAPVFAAWEEEGSETVYATYLFCLPRHTEKSDRIRIELYEGGSGGYVNGANVGTFIAEQIGYSWVEDDLGDFVIDWDFSRLDIDPARGIRVRDWTQVDTYVDPM